MQNNRRTAVNDRLLLVEGDPEIGRRLSGQLREHGWRVVWAASAGEAKQLLSDALFLELGLDALLISYYLPDATATRVIQDFRSEWPRAPVAMMTDADEIAVNMWARSRNVRLMYTPLHQADLKDWLQYVKVPA